MSNRHEWKMPYRGNVLLKAVQDKIIHHMERRDWWSKKKEEVITSIKGGGIEITQSIVDELQKGGYSGSNVRHDRGPTVQIDVALMNHLNEAHRKVEEHKNKEFDYKQWEQVLTSQQDAHFDLNMDDWIFFFGK